MAQLLEDFNTFLIPISGVKGSQIGSTEEFDNFTDWDDSAAGPLNAGFDDAVDIGIYTPKLALDFGTATASGEIIHSSIAKTNMLIEAEFYLRRITFDMTLFFMGLRIDTASNDDGYFAGLDFNAAFRPKLTIKKRISGIFSDLLPVSIFELKDVAGWLVDTSLRMDFMANEEKLEARLTRVSDGLVIAAVGKKDSTFSNSGTVSIVKTRNGIAGRECRMDSIKFFDFS